jgi:hypothetical protein
MYGFEDNIERFNYYVGSIFAVLQSAFPCRVRLDLLQLVGCEMCPETHDSSGRYTGLYLFHGEVQDMREELDFVYETANWLYETEYLIGVVGATELGKRAFVTLSPKALEILKVVPTSIEAEKTTIGQELSEAFNSAAKDKVAAIAGKALSYLFRVGWGTVLGPHVGGNL